TDAPKKIRRPQSYQTELSKSGVFRRRMESHQSQAVELHGNTPVRAKCLELVARFVAAGPSHDDVPVLAALGQLLPDHLPGATRHIADVYARPHLQEPQGQPATQAGRDVFRDDDQEA